MLISIFLYFVNVKHFEFRRKTMCYIICFLTSRDATSSHLPNNEAKTVHVSHYKRLGLVQGLFQHLRGHIPLRSNSEVGRDIHLVGVTEKGTRNTNGKKICEEMYKMLQNSIEMSLQTSKTCVVPVKLDRQAEVCNTAESVLFYQDVFTLQVSVCNGRFALCAVDLCVQVTEARYGRVGQFQQSLDVQGVGLEVVVQGSILVVVCD